MVSEQAGECRLLAGPAAIGAQLLLGALALASLLYKRHIERPQRPLKIWGLDVSKQVVSMLAAHVCGMLIALIAHHSVSAAESSECAWYFVAFSFDTTIGLLLTIGLHKGVLRAARWYIERHGQGLAAQAADESEVPNREHWADVLLLCGNYGDPPSYRCWGIQLGEWVACVVLARVMCGTLVVLLGGLLVHIAHGLDSLFAGHPTLLLYFVMICCPLIMNICQVLIQDLVLKWRRGSSDTAAAGDTSLVKMTSPNDDDNSVAERRMSLLGPGNSERSAPV